MVFFFFFQAEDGIRDVAVTGVQTCALPICFRLRLIKAHRRDFGLTVDTGRHGRQIEAWLSHACHYLDRGNTLGRRLMRQKWRTYDVADRVNALAGGAERVVYLDEAAALELDAGFFQAKVAA